MKRRTFMTIAGALVVSMLTFAGPGIASADQLDQLRASGAVGEAFDGYARARDGSVKDYVKSVNAQRRSIYVKRAKKQGVSADQVGRVYATEIAKSAPEGTYLLGEDGKWRRK